VVDLARDCGTALFLIDDVHFLDYRRHDSTEVNKHIKALTSLIGATFVYAGIDCANSGFLNEGRSPETRRKSQVRWRVVRYEVGPFRGDTHAQRSAWASLLHTIERKLVLMRAPERMLSGELAEFLFERTHGSIGILCPWLRDAAVSAIESGEERITKALLEQTPLPDID